MSDTPRTNDECRRRAQLRVSAWNVSADFARELERELAAVKADLAQRTAERDRARMLFLDRHPSVISGDMDAPRVARMLGWDCFDAKEVQR